MYTENFRVTEKGPAPPLSRQLMRNQSFQNLLSSRSLLKYFLVHLYAARLLNMLGSVMSCEAYESVLGGPRGRVVKSADISLPHLTIRSSHRCDWCGFEPRSGHVRQAKFCLRVCQVVFLGVLSFSPHLLIGLSHMS